MDTESCMTAARASGSSVDVDEDGVAGMPPTLFMLSDAVEPWVKLVISEKAEGETGSTCTVCCPSTAAILAGNSSGTAVVVA